jgi:branched chain amino acid efflux pump
MEGARERRRAGIRRGLPFGIAVFAISVSFGVLARSRAEVRQPRSPPGVLLNARYLAMGLALAPSLRGNALSRGAFAMPLVDASWAAASRGDGTFDPWYMVGVSIPQYVGWVLGTVVGVLVGSRLGDPKALGLDALFPAFFIALLFEEVRGRRRMVAAAGGAAIALVLTPLVPAGLPILAAGAAAVAASRMRS